MDNTRNSNFELLRIILMFLIVAYHYGCHGITDFVSDINVWNQIEIGKRLFISFLLPGGYVGVSTFFMITGYFLIYKKSKRFSKIIRVVLFYVLINGLLLFFSFSQENLKSFMAMFFLPFSSNSWWFATSYIFLMLILPFLNAKLNLLNKKGFFLILIVLFVFSYIIPTCFQSLKMAPFYIFQRAVFFYSLGAYLRKNTKITTEKTGFLFLVLCLVLWVLNSFIKFKFNYCSSVLVKFVTDGIRNFIIVPIISILMLKSFESFNIKNNKVINLISSTTFGIYLFHDSYIAQRLIWKDILKVYENQLGSDYFILLALISIICVFLFGFFVELFRIKIVENLMLNKVINGLKIYTNNKFIEKTDGVNEKTDSENV